MLFRSHSEGKGDGIVNFSNATKSQYTVPVNLPHYSRTEENNDVKSTVSAITSENLYGHDSYTQTTTHTVTAILTPVTELENKAYTEEVSTLIFNKTFNQHKSEAQEYVGTLDLTKVVTVQHATESDDYNDAH